VLNVNSGQPNDLVGLIAAITVLAARLRHRAEA